MDISLSISCGNILPIAGETPSPLPVVTAVPTVEGAWQAGTSLTLIGEPAASFEGSPALISVAEYQLSLDGVAGQWVDAASLALPADAADKIAEVAIRVQVTAAPGSWSLPAAVGSAPVTPAENPNQKPVTVDTQSSWTTPGGEVITVSFAGPTRHTLDAEAGVLYVYTDQGSVQIDSVTPASQPVFGRRANGLVSRPCAWPGDDGNGGKEVETQSFDEGLTNCSSPTYRWQYDNAGDIDPGNTGAPLIYAQGAEDKLVKYARRSGAGETSNSPSSGLLPIIICASVPEEDAVTDYSGLGPHVWYREADLSSLAPNENVPPNFKPVGDVLQWVPAISDEIGSHSGERRRSFSTARYALETVPGDIPDTSYGGSFADPWADWLTLYLSNVPTAEERSRMRKVGLTHLAQFYALHQRGARFSSGAGQDWFSWAIIEVFAMEYGNTAIQAAFADFKSHFDNLKLIDSARIGQPVPGASGIAAQPFLASHEGTYFPIPNEESSSWNARYLNISTHIMARQITAFLRAGASALTRLLALNPANGARLEAIDWIVKSSPPFNISYPLYSDDAESYALANIIAGRTLTTAAPKQPPTNDINFTAGGAGEITFDATGVGYRTEALGNLSDKYHYPASEALSIADADVQMSLDGLQWVDALTDVSINTAHSISGLPAAQPLLGRYRFKTASGDGEWSRAHHADLPYRFGDLSAAYGYAVVGGTAVAGTLALTTDPQIMIETYPGSGPILGLVEAAAATYAAGSTPRLYAGKGMLAATAKAPVTMTAEWFLDGISQGTGDSYTVTGDGAVRCDVTYTDADLNTLTVSSSVVTIGATAAVPTSIAHIPQSPSDLMTYDGPADATDSVFAGVDIGAADANRWVVLAVGTLNSTGEPSSITLNVGGTDYAFTELVGNSHAGANKEGVGIWVSTTKVPTGTSGTVTVSKSGGVFSLGVEAYRLIKNTDATTALDTSLVDSTGSSTAEALDLNTEDGGALAIVGQVYSSSGGNQITFDPDLKDGDRDLRSGERFAYGHATNTAAETPRAQSAAKSLTGTASFAAVSWGS